MKLDENRKAQLGELLALYEGELDYLQTVKPREKPDLEAFGNNYPHSLFMAFEVYLSGQVPKPDPAKFRPRWFGKLDHRLAVEAVEDAFVRAEKALIADKAAREVEARYAELKRQMQSEGLPA